MEESGDTLLQEGQTIRDTYEVEKFLGEGAFAEVYRVHHRFLGKQAMKVFKRGGMTVEEIEDLMGEAVILSRIGHPNIVRVFDANVLRTKYGIYGYFTMENVPSGSLEKYWTETPNQPVTVAVDIIKQICRGLSVAHLHKPPIVHRDIKPQNILIGVEASGPRARISDFGLAKKVNPMTLLASSAGTPIFKPPEALTDPQGDSCSADVWAIGVTLYYLLTGYYPYDISQAEDHSIRSIFGRKYRSASAINPDVNTNLDRTIGKCLDIDPKKRYQNAAEVLEALEAPQAKSRPSSKAHDEPQNPEAAIAIATKLQEEGNLKGAAAVMSRAIEHWPQLAKKYTPRISLWERGIDM